MQLKTLLITSASVAVSQAASFTNVGYDVRVGTQFNLTLTDLTGTGTLTLKYGNALDLQTAEVLTSSLTESYYLYTPPASLGAGIAYAFEIQDASGVNYSPQFQVSQATGTISASASSTSSSASSSGTPSASASVTGSATNSSSTGVPTFAATASGTNTTATATSTITSTSTSTHSSTATSSKTASSTSSSSTTAPTTAADSGAAGLASPLAFVFLACAAFFLQ